MTFETGVVSANGLDFGYLAAGDADRPLALCLHGFPDTAHTWRHLLPVLAEAGYRAVAPFLRGYAPTSVPADGCFSTGALVADVTALHEALGGDGDAVLVGHDWGALISYGTLAFAPERWRRAVTMAVPPPASMMSGFFDYEQIRRSFYIFVFQTPLAELIAGMDDMDFLAKLWRDWSPGYDAGFDVARVKDALRDPANLASAIGYYRAMLGTTPPPADRYLAEQEAASGVPGSPVLYLHGEDDGCLSADLAAGAGAALGPGSEVRLVAKAGHFLHLEQPDAVAAAVVDWLAVEDQR
jgi:pimeloyl-ACP methyl ester carboxylesterase